MPLFSPWAYLVFPRSQRVSATLVDPLLYLVQGSVGRAAAYEF
jgi:hypothetical protein